jgi:hypothetical protein
MDRLVTILQWSSSGSEIVRIHDEGVLAPLIPALVSGASSDCRFSAQCTNILRILTRHDFPAGSSDWQKWYQDHGLRHPVYSQPLDRAAKLCADSFRKSLEETAKTDLKVARVNRFVGRPRSGTSFRNTYLWKLESRPEEPVGLPRFADDLPPRDRLKELGICFVVGHTSRLEQPERLLWRQDYKKLNVTVWLASPTEDEYIQDALIEIAKEACKVVSDYDTFHTNDAMPSIKLP